MAKYFIFKLDFSKKRNNHENGMEMKVYTHVVKTTPNEVLCRSRKACYGWKVVL